MRSVAPTTQPVPNETLQRVRRRLYVRSTARVAVAAAIIVVCAVVYSIVNSATDPSPELQDIVAGVAVAAIANVVYVTRGLITSLRALRRVPRG